MVLQKMEYGPNSLDQFHSDFKSKATLELIFTSPENVDSSTGLSQAQILHQFKLDSIREHSVLVLLKTIDSK